MIAAFYIRAFPVEYVKLRRRRPRANTSTYSPPPPSVAPDETGSATSATPYRQTTNVEWSMSRDDNTDRRKRALGHHSTDGFPVPSTIHLLIQPASPSIHIWHRGWPADRRTCCCSHDAVGQRFNLRPTLRRRQRKVARHAQTQTNGCSTPSLSG
jgi:hypothetical protein